MAKTSGQSFPNLFLVGASKTGTSSLHSYLCHHPDISGANPKEPSFFVEQEQLRSQWPSQALNSVSFDLGAYLASFNDPTAKYKLDSSTLYSQCTHCTNVPQRIFEKCPTARIIYIVRHPTIRTLSHYWQEFREMNESRPIDEAVVEGSIYVETSNYFRQMCEYLKYFEPQNIKVVLSENLLNNRKEELDEIFHWLGLETLEMDETLRTEGHKTGAKTRVPQSRLVRTIRDSSLWQQARNFVPDTILQGARSLAFKEIERAEFNTTNVTKFLDSYFAERSGEFDQLFGVGFERSWFQ